MKSLGRLYGLRDGLTVALTVLLLSSILWAKETDGSDWPRWRGQMLDGKGQGENVFRSDDGFGLKVTWKKTLGSGYASISVVGGQAVTMFSDSTFDYVVALDAETGDEQWRFKIDSTYVGHNGSHNGPISTPLIDGDLVYAFAPKGQLIALNRENGKMVWSSHVIDEHKASIPFYGFSTVPIIEGDVLVVETGGIGTTISGLNKMTGELLWTAGNDTVQYQSPITMNVHGQNQLLCVGDRFVYGMSPTTGDKLWEYEHKGNRRSRGGRSINPVVAGENRVFLAHGGSGGGAQFEIKKTDDGFKAEDGWTTTGIKQSYDTAVFHDGYLYGYSNRFLSCVDAATGKAAWKSRPPGDGFSILVDGHLVILTKQGTLHIAEATPEKYTEVVSTQVFDNLTWTPPSFANGKIYVRSLREIAAIDVVAPDASRPAAVTDIKIEYLNPDGDFAGLLKKVESAADGEKKPLLDAYFAKQKSFPIIEDNRFAHIVFYGEANDIGLFGDMLNSGQEAPLTQVAGTNLFFGSFELESDARLDYAFRKDFDNFVTDPRNTHTVPTAFLPGGQASVLQMDEWKRPNHFEESEGVAKGTVETLEFDSKAIGNKRTIHVYLPAGYGDSKDRYPSVYVNYGGNAKDMALMPNTLDNLIASNRIRPVIAVFSVASQTSFREYARGQRDQHAQMFVEELLPQIDEKYRTLANAENRLFMGADEGGYAAIYAAFKYPGTATMLAGQSTHFFPGSGGEEITALVENSDKLDVDFYLDWATYGQRGGGFHWKDFNVAFVKLLKEKSYDVSARQVNEGFGWASWRNRTDEILEKFFGMNQTKK